MARYDQRIATRISRDASNRLRLAALIERVPLSALLDSVIVKAFPPAEELARLLDVTASEAAS